MGVPQNIMRALCAVVRPDHFKFASYGPATLVQVLTTGWLEWPEDEANA